MFVISNQIREEIFAHARECAPEESCGLIVGEQYVRCENIAELDRGHTFQIDPAVVLEAQLSGQLRAIVHSHPSGMNGPSKTDMEQQAEMDVPWGIVVLDPVYQPRLFFWGDSLPCAPYVGREFRHGIADCYALVRDWYRQEKGLVLPLTPRDPEWWNIGQTVIEDNLKNFDFDPLDRDAPLQVGDVLLFKIGAPTINHTGIYVGNGYVLHHLSNRLSTRDVLGPWKQKFHVKTMRARPAALQSIAQDGCP